MPQTTLTGCGMLPWWSKVVEEDWSKEAANPNSSKDET
jgi:hypothetical protein